MSAVSNSSRPRCACGKAIFYTRKQARQHGSKFQHAQHRGTYLCPVSKFWHLGRLSDPRKFGAAPAGVRIATRQQLRKLAAELDPWVFGLVEDELELAAWRQSVGLHVAVLIAASERCSDRNPTLRELADQLPDDFLERLAEPDAEWDGDADGWLREVRSATVVMLAIHGVITLSLDDGTARIGPGYSALLETVA